MRTEFTIHFSDDVDVSGMQKPHELMPKNVKCMFSADFSIVFFNS